jgi:hypothetical protein
LVVGKSSSRVNEEMGKLPIWKLSELTHEIGNWTHKILVRKIIKSRKIHGQRGGCKASGFGDHFLKRESRCNSLVREENLKMNLFLGTRIVGQCLLTKLINGVAENMSD